MTLVRLSGDWCSLRRRAASIAAILIEPPEIIHVATVTHPHAGDQVVTAHKGLKGAEGRLDAMALLWALERDSLTASIIQLPLMP